MEKGYACHTHTHTHTYTHTCARAQPAEHCGVNTAGEMEKGYACHTHTQTHTHTHTHTHLCTCTACRALRCRYGRRDGEGLRIPQSRAISKGSTAGVTHRLDSCVLGGTGAMLESGVVFLRMRAPPKAPLPESRTGWIPVCVKGHRNDARKWSGFRSLAQAGFLCV